MLLGSGRVLVAVGHASDCIYRDQSFELSLRERLIFTADDELLTAGKQAALLETRFAE
jgi:hypothetical protein